MALGLTQQIGNKPCWFRKKNGEFRHDHTRYVKKLKVRRERRRAKREPECMSQYGKYSGWWY